MKRFLFLILISFAAPLTGCGGDTGQTPGSTGGGAAYLKIDLSLNNTQVVFHHTATFNSLTAPHPQMGGSYALVAWKGGKVAYASAFKFPAVLRKEGVDAKGNKVSETVDLAGNSAATLVIPQDSYDRLTVVDPNGQTVAQQAGGLTHQAEGIRPLGVPGAPAPLTGKAQYWEAPNLIFLNAADTDYIPPFIASGITSVLDFSNLAPSTQTNILDGLSTLAPGPLGALQYILIAHLPNDVKMNGGTPLAYTVGAFIVLNADFVNNKSVPEWMAHESAHAYSYLLDDGTRGIPPGNWAPEVVNAAKAVMQKYALSAGFIDFFGQMHNDGILNGLAGDYQGENSLNISNSDAHKMGFVEAYGSTNVDEDLATYTANLQEEQNYGLATFCTKLSTNTGPFPIGLTIPYVKAQLLANTGFVTPQRIQGCLGASMTVAGPNGVYLMDRTGNPSLSISDVSTNQFEGSLQDGAVSLQGTSPNDRVYVQIAPAMVGWSRLGSEGVAGAGGTVTAAGGAMTGSSQDGFALVSAASADQISITVFNMEMQTSSGLVVIPMATFAYPKPKAPATSSCRETVDTGTNWGHAGDLVACYDHVDTSPACAVVSDFRGTVAGWSADPCPKSGLIATCFTPPQGAPSVMQYQYLYPAYVDKVNYNYPPFGMTPIEARSESCVADGGTWTGPTK